MRGALEPDCEKKMVMRHRRTSISAKPVGVGAASQPLILASEQSSLLTRIAEDGQRFMVRADEKLIS